MWRVRKVKRIRLKIKIGQFLQINLTIRGLSVKKPGLNMSFKSKQT